VATVARGCNAGLATSKAAVIATVPRVLFPGKKNSAFLSLLLAGNIRTARLLAGKGIDLGSRTILAQRGETNIHNSDLNPSRYDQDLPFDSAEGTADRVGGQSCRG
jgi:hypothetical protein